MDRQLIYTYWQKDGIEPNFWMNYSSWCLICPVSRMMREIWKLVAVIEPTSMVIWNIRAKMNEEINQLYLTIRGLDVYILTQHGVHKSTLGQNSYVTVSRHFSTRIALSVLYSIRHWSNEEVHVRHHGNPMSSSFHTGARRLCLWAQFVKKIHYLRHPV